MYRIKIFKSVDDKKLKSHWKEIYSKNNCYPQSSYEWMANWWKYFQKKSRELFIVAVEEDNKIVGIGPFMIEKNILFKELKFVGSGLTDFHEILALSQNRELIYSNILNCILNKHGYDLINLEQISDDSRLYKFLEGNKKLKKREMIKCLTVNFNSSSWEEYSTKLRGKFRRDINRRIRKLTREGKIQFIKLKALEGRKEYLKKLFELHIKKWEQESQVSKLSQENIRKFITKIFLECPDTIIYILSHNNNIVSYELGFFKNDVYYDWNTSYNPEYHAYSVGKVIYKFVAEDLIKNGYKKMNFMRGDYEWKRRWMTDNEKSINYQFLSHLSSTKGYIGARYYLEWRSWLKSRLKNILDKAFIKKILINLRH